MIRTSQCLISAILTISTKLAFRGQSYVLIQFLYHELCQCYEGPAITASSPPVLLNCWYSLQCSNQKAVTSHWQDLAGKEVYWVRTGVSFTVEPVIAISQAPILGQIYPQQPPQSYTIKRAGYSFEKSHQGSFCDLHPGSFLPWHLSLDWPLPWIKHWMSWPTRCQLNIPYTRIGPLFCLAKVIFNCNMKIEIR